MGSVGQDINDGEGRRYGHGAEDAHELGLQSVSRCAPGTIGQDEALDDEARASP